MCSFESVLSLSLSLSLCLSLSALPLTVCVSVFSAFSMSLCVSSVSGPSCQCPAVVSLGAAYLGSLHSHGGGQRRLCRSVPHQSDCSQLRQSPSVLLPLHWPKLTAGGQVRAAAGPEFSEYDTMRMKNPFNSPPDPSLPHTAACHHHFVSFHSILRLPAFPFSAHPPPKFKLRACASVSYHSQVWVIARVRPLHQLEKHRAPHTESSSISYGTEVDWVTSEAWQILTFFPSPSLIYPPPDAARRHVSAWCSNTAI